MNRIENEETSPLMSLKELALLGDGEVAYIKQVNYRRCNGSCSRRLKMRPRASIFLPCSAPTARLLR